MPTTEKEKTLAQIIAVEKNVKSRVYNEVTNVHRKLMHEESMKGFNREFQPLEDSDETYEPETKPVTVNAADLLKYMGKLMTEHFDVEFLKDKGNMVAKADIVVNGVTLASDIPVTYLLYLEKQLTDVRTIIQKIPTLSTEDNFQLNKETGFYASAIVKTHKTKKKPKVIVHFEPTKEHPGKSELVYEDVISGYWNTIKTSGALPPSRKQTLIERVNDLLDAVKFAREKANMVTVPDEKIGNTIFDFLLS